MNYLSIRSVPRIKLIKSIRLNKSFNNVLREFNINPRNGNEFTILKNFVDDNNISVTHFRSKSNRLNSNLFKSIKTKNEAYWLGFLMADGYITDTTQTIRIHINDRDIEIIHRFKKFCNSINVIGSYYDKRYPTENYAYFSVTSRSVVNNLRQYGCVSPKAKNIRLPSLKSHKLMQAFLMGYYDGDGFEQNPLVCSSSKRFLLDIRQYFNIKSKVTKKKNIYYLYIGIDLMRKLLLNYEDSLKRKRNLLKKLK